MAKRRSQSWNYEILKEITTLHSQTYELVNAPLTMVSRRIGDSISGARLLLFSDNYLYAMKTETPVKYILQCVHCSQEGHIWKNDVTTFVNPTESHNHVAPNARWEEDSD